MSLKLSIPCLIALIAFFVADEQSHLIQIVYRNSLKFGNRKSVESRLAQIGKSQSVDFENFRISQLAYIVAGIGLATLALTLSFINLGLFLLLITSLPFITFALTERNLTKRVVTRK